MDYSRETLLLNPKLYPHAFYLSKHIDINYRINEGKSRVNIITIPTLINVTPLLPSYDDVMKTSKKVYQLIIKPLIENLEAINSLFYDFLDPDGNIIENPLEYFRGTGSWTTFIKSCVSVNYEEYPTHKERTTRKQIYAKNATTIKRNKSISKTLEKRIETLEKQAKGEAECTKTDT